MHTELAVHSAPGAAPHAVPSGWPVHSPPPLSLPLPLPLPSATHTPPMHDSPIGQTSPLPHGAPAGGAGAKQALHANTPASDQRNAPTFRVYRVPRESRWSPATIDA